MKAKIQRGGVGVKVEMSSLESGDWFVDGDGSLCMVADEGRYVFLDEEGDATLGDVDDEQVTPIQVTITY